MANNTRFGLAATLVTGDPEPAERVSAQLNAGTVWVNCFFVRDLGAPFGGNGKSGIGREGGDYSFDFYCDIKNSVFSPTGWTVRADREDGRLMGEVVGAGLLAHVPDDRACPRTTRRELNGGAGQHPGRRACTSCAARSSTPSTTTPSWCSTRTGRPRWSSWSPRRTGAPACSPPRSSRAG